MTHSDQTDVLYNADCPVCRFEIEHYRKGTEAKGLPIRYDDLNAGTEGWGVDAETAAKRLHVRHNGEVLSGMPAFRVLWQQMPGYRWLARVTGWPVVRPLSEVTYDRVLAPALYAWHRRRQRRAADRAV
jgi:predicted DCC family thiol-disulfide oxidoreductase YuxK